MAQVLREAGHAPALVRDVRAAQTWVAEGNRPAAVLSDLMVAGSAGPDRLPAELAAMFPGAPVALMTGVPRNRRAALGVTHARILEKPFELEMLIDSGEHDAAAPRHRGAVKVFAGASAFAAARADDRARRCPRSRSPSATSTACTAGTRRCWRRRGRAPGAAVDRRPC